MTKQEFAKAVELAKSDKKLCDEEALDVFLGCGYKDFVPVYVTLELVGKFIRWQAQYMNGEWDANELNQLARVARQKFLIIG